jgi:hypothetical protein
MEEQQSFKLSVIEVSREKKPKTMGGEKNKDTGENASLTPQLQQKVNTA